MLRSSLIGVWHTREVLPLFERIKSSSARFDGRVSQQLVPADQYDAIIVIGRVSPPEFLYSLGGADMR